MKKIFLTLTLLLGITGFAEADLLRIDGTNRYLQADRNLKVTLVDDEKCATDFRIETFCYGGCYQQLIFVVPAKLGLRDFKDQLLYLGCDESETFKLFSFSSSYLTFLKEIQKESKAIFWKQSLSDPAKVVLTLGSIQLALG